MQKRVECYALEPYRTLVLWIVVAHDIYVAVGRGRGTRVCSVLHGRSRLDKGERPHTTDRITSDHVPWIVALITGKHMRDVSGTKK